MSSLFGTGTRPATEYRAWKAMRWRCNPKNPSKVRYHDRGIGVCKRWDSFEYFLNDMGLRPSGLHSLDRINNNGNYEPSNCRWADRITQTNNTKRTNFIIVDGNRINLMDIVRASGIHPETIRGRIKKGWSYDKIISPPIKASERQRNEYGYFV